jgi:hypothetical protein
MPPPTVAETYALIRCGTRRCTSIARAAGKILIADESRLPVRYATRPLDDTFLQRKRCDRGSEDEAVNDRLAMGWIDLDEPRNCFVAGHAGETRPYARLSRRAACTTQNEISPSRRVRQKWRPGQDSGGCGSVPGRNARSSDRPCSARRRAVAPPDDSCHPPHAAPAAAPSSTPC